MQETSITDLLLWASQRISSDSALFEAEVLLAHVLKVERSYFRSHPQVAIPSASQTTFEDLVNARAKGMPIAYLTQSQPFWKLDLQVSSDVLIPRADTETLVEEALLWIPQDKPCRVLDLGTGSGAIALSLAFERPQSEFLACDISSDALILAKQNAASHQIHNIKFLRSDWFSALESNPSFFDLIVANPPYIAANDPHLSQGDLRFEPKTALVAKDDGLADIRQIIEHAAHFLKSGGRLIIEHGMDQGEIVRQLFLAQHYQSVKTLSDLGGRERVTLGAYVAPNNKS